MANYKMNFTKRTCVTPECRASYCHVLEPKAFGEGDDPAYSCQIVIPKEGTEDFIKDLLKQFENVVNLKFDDKKKRTTMKKVMRVPLRDGDDPSEAEKNLEGFWFMNATNKRKQPHIIGAMGKPVDPNTLDDDDIYSGMYARFMCEFFWYDTKGNKGVGCSLTAVMKTRDGERLDGGTTADQAASEFEEFAADFGDDGDDDSTDFEFK